MKLEEIVTILAILFLHWVADFVFQKELWAVNKSKSNHHLTAHVLMYSFIIAMGMALIFYLTVYNMIGSIAMGIFFAIISYIFHWCTDYVTSRIVAKRFARKHYGSDIPNFGAFTVIGIDQFLHYCQLLLTYYLLT